MLDNFTFDNNNNKIRVQGVLKSLSPIKTLYFRGYPLRELYQLNNPLTRRDGSIRDNIITIGLTIPEAEKLQTNYNIGDEIRIYGQVDSYSKMLPNHEGKKNRFYDPYIMVQKICPLNKEYTNTNIGGLKGIIKHKYNKETGRYPSKEFIIGVQRNALTYSNISAIVNNPDLFEEADHFEIGQEIGIKFRMVKYSYTNRIGLTILNFISPQYFDQGFDLDYISTDNNTPCL